MTLRSSRLYVESYGFDAKAIKERLKLLELTIDDVRHVEQLQKYVIHPSVNHIVEEFYTYLFRSQEYARFILGQEQIQALKKTQTHYLLSLGEGFQNYEYFESRLKIGVAHQRIGLPLSLYQCAFRKLHQLIVEHIPTELNEFTTEQMQLFLNKIIALDMSIAIDSYHITDINNLETSIADLKKKQKRLRRLAEIDPLTGVANRAHIIDVLRHECEKRSIEANEELSIIMADLDNMDRINDQFSYLVGDHVIKEVAQKLRIAVGDEHHCGRYGGTVFLFVLPKTNIEQAKQVAKTIRMLVTEAPVIVNFRAINVTISQGITQVNQSSDIIHLLRAVDSNLHKAKSHGHNAISAKS
ncbi:MAG: diguanylate cyclase [Gammaproteobacteria bacterium]|nr:diguanylate cyclase [Gammaproteobacteria bacterium]MDH5730042.1 diguanylate cyclase [Gammaproteobacteria bacterium]